MSTFAVYQLFMHLLAEVWLEQTILHINTFLVYKNCITSYQQMIAFHVQLVHLVALIFEY